MKRRTKKLFKKSIASLAILGFVAGSGTLIGLSFSKERETTSFYVSAQSPYTSLNYNKTNEAKNPNVSSVFQNSIDGFFFYNSYGAGEFNVKKVLGYSSSSYSFLSNYQYNNVLSSANSNPDTDPFEKYSSDASEYYLGISNSISDGPVYITKSLESDVSNPGYIDFFLKIKDSAKWQNGEEVGAEDFIDSIRYSINPKNQSVIYNEGAEIYGYNSCRSYLSNNNIDLDAIWNDVVINKNEKYKDNCGKLFNEGVVATSKNRLPAPYLDTASEKYENLYKNNKDNSLIKNHYIRYRFPVSNTSGSTRSISSSFIPSLSKKQIFYPVNRRFIESIDGGYLKFGTSPETFISNGPFYLAEADFDYELYFKKNEYFWDSDRVLSKSYKIKVIKDVTAAQTQFRIGKIDNVDLTVELYNTLSKDPKIAGLIKRGQSSAMSRGFSFNTYGPMSNYTQNPFLRNAIKFSINRENLVSASGVKGTIPTYTFSTTYSGSDSEFKSSNGAGFDSYLYKKDENGTLNPLKISYNYDYEGFKIKRDLVFSAYKSKTEASIVSSYEQIDRESISRDYDFDPALALYNLNKFYETSGFDKNKVLTLKLLFVNSGTEKTQAVTFKRQVEKNLNNKIKIELVAKPVQTLTLEKNGFYNTYDIIYREIKDDLLISPFNILRYLMIKPDKNSSKNLNDVSVIGNTTIFNPYDEDDQTSILGFWKKQADQNNLSLEKYLNNNFDMDISSQDLENIKSFISQWIISVNDKILTDFSDMKPTKNKNSILIREDMEINSEIIKNYVNQSSGMPNNWYKNKIDYSQVSGIIDFIKDKNDDEISSDLSKINLDLNSSETVDRISLGDDILRIIINLEKIIKISSPSILTFQSSQTYYASSLLNAVSYGFLFPTGYSFRHAYKCSSPPTEINKFIPGCEVRYGSEIIIGE